MIQVPERKVRLFYVVGEVGRPGVFELPDIRQMDFYISQAVSQAGGPGKTARMSKCLLVRFDEGNYLLKEWTFPKSVDELLYQLKNDDVIGRSWAASELREHGGRADVAAALSETARSDDFWAVRMSAVAALGEMKREEDIPFFKEKCGDDKSRVRAEALDVLGEYGRAELVPFLKERYEEEDSYLAQAEALRSIGKCGDASLIPFLEKAAQTRSYRNVIKRAAEFAIETIRGRSSISLSIQVVF